jgi:flagellar hook-basal body complex protein FliE
MSDLRITPASAATRAITPVRLPELSPASGQEGFGAALGRAIGDVNALQHQAREAAMSIATGQAADSAQNVALIEKASISFQFALQIRNKLLEAYQEIMRMPV